MRPTPKVWPAPPLDPYCFTSATWRSTSLRRRAGAGPSCSSMATTATTKPEKAAKKPKPVEDRNGLAEWVVTFLLLIYGTSMIAQPFVIPTSSMHNTLLTGDHLIVDKMAYAPAGAVSKYLLPYTPPKRGDIIVFRHPILLQEDYVKRVIGVQGDHIKLV